jgi:hypothetical protein
VDVAAAEGGSSADLQRTARNLGYWPFRRCYEEGLRRDQRLTGKVSLDLALGADGAVEAAAVVAATAADESVVLCVAREARQLPLGAYGSEARARLDVTLWRGDEPVPVSPAVPHAAELRETLRARWPEAARCYASALARQPDAGGRIDLRFRVGPEGDVLDVIEEGDDRFGDAEATACVLAAYRGARLTPPADSRSQEGRFTYSLHFEAAEP